MRRLNFPTLLFLFAFSSFTSCKPPQSPEEKRIADSIAIREAFDEAPVLSPEEALKSFRLEDGFDIRLVAAEPKVSTPVAMTFDRHGRIWVVEMPSYMPDTNGIGEDLPTGDIAILEDTDGDGLMDDRKIFMDSLVLPRAVCLIEGGVLVAEPPRLWYVENNNGIAGKKVLVDSAYAIGGNVEHQPNGLYRALDNWIYNAKSSKRYRKKGDKWLIEDTRFRGQWGISQDDMGRLFYNNNSANLLGDYFPPRFGAANPFQRDAAGYVENIVPNNRVYPARPTTAINRGYLEGMLDDSLRLVNFTAASGPVIYRGGLFGEEYQGNAFVAEPSAYLIKRNILEGRVNYVEGKQAYEGREFLASTDERFRPVSLYNGPDGALYIVDMYRGIIQHITYLTDYLKNEIGSRSLSDPLNRGRIYKILPEGSSPDPVTFPADAAGLVNLLDHGNGWVRDQAQQLLVDGKPPGSIPLLKAKLERGGNELGRIHALWTLEGLYALEWTDVRPLLEEKSKRMVAQALTVLPSVLDRSNQAAAVFAAVRPLAKDAELAPYVVYVAGEIQRFDPQGARAFFEEVVGLHPDDPYVADAVINDLQGREAAFLERLDQANADTSLLVRKHLAGVLENIEESKEAALKEALLKELARGKALFKNICQTCHGADGKGIRTLAPPLNRSEWVTGDKHRLIAIALFGLTGPVEVNGKRYDQPEISGEMPGIGSNDALSDDDIAQILSFVRNAWNNDAGLVTAEDVKQVRQQLQGREGAFTIEEIKQLPF